MTPTRRELLALLLLLASTLPAVADDGGEGEGEGDGDGEGDSGDDGGGDDGDDGGGDDGDDGGDDGHDGGGGHGRREREHDHDDAREALRKGEIIPLSEALEIVAETQRGRVIDVSLNRNLFGAVYTFKLRARSGRVTTVRMDARTGKLIGLFGF